MPELKHILYVEDEPDIRTLVQMALEYLGGYRLTLCNSGPEALATLERVQPDLALLDVMMPGMDGPTLMGRIHALPGLEALPVVFVTAKAYPQEIQHFKALGAIGVIAKPFDPMQLPGQLQQLWHNWYAKRAPHEQ